MTNIKKSILQTSCQIPKAKKPYTIGEEVLSHASYLQLKKLYSLI